MTSKTTKKSAKSKIAPKRTTTRRLRVDPYKSFRLQKRVKHAKKPLTGAFKLFRISLRFLLSNWKLFGGIIAVYLILDVLLVKGLGSTSDIPSLKKGLEELFGGENNQVITGLTLFGLLLGSAGSVPSELAGAYQSILLTVVSLAVIWSLRQTLARQKISLSDSFYKSMYPAIPFLLVLLVIGLQLIPLILSSYLYGIIIGGGLAITAIEKLLWSVLLFLLALLSLYMITSSIFALYIVTLPDMRPMQALRSARELVRFRRWTIMRKLLFLPFVLLTIAALITLPVILFLTPITEWTFFILTVLTLPVVHSYMYHLYRELL